MRQINLFILWIAVAAIGRLVPHLPNTTPLISLCVLAGCYFDRKHVVLIALLSLFISDMLLSIMYSYPLVGSWTLFTYTGLLLITGGSHHFFRTNQSGALNLFIFTGVSSIVYWIWTNFGTWLMTTLYPHTTSGLWTCYIAAIPFLRNELLGSLVWMSAFCVFGALGLRFTLKLNHRIF